MDNSKTEKPIPLAIIYCYEDQLPETSRILANLTHTQMAVCMVAADKTDIKDIDLVKYVRPTTGFKAYFAMRDQKIETGKAYLVTAKSDLKIEDNQFVLHDCLSLPCNNAIIQSQNMAIVVCLVPEDKICDFSLVDNQNTLTITKKAISPECVTQPPLYRTNLFPKKQLQMEDVERQIAKFCNQIYTPTQIDWELQSNNNILQELFRLIKSQISQDFSLYKRSTIRRRTEKRMASLQIKSLETYLALLQHNKKEVELLAQEFLINVTHFFRDQEAFDTLQEQVVSKIIESGRNNEIRVWVPACSSGEEAYSLAILLHNYAKLNYFTPSITIFASDIDTMALAKAREGIYTAEAVENLPSHFVREYFQHKNGYFAIIKEIRDMIIFAEQDIIQNPPFSKVDLVSCRNLLIYLEPEAQQRVLSIFHYSLIQGGFLFLGNSESIGDGNLLFKTIDRKWKIYQKANASNLGHRIWNLPQFMNYKRESNLPKIQKKEAIKELWQNTMLNRFVPSSAIVNSNGDIIYLQGKMAQFLEYPQGEPSTNIIKATKQGLTIPLANALRKAKQSGEEVIIKQVKVLDDDKTQFCDLVVTPLPNDNDVSDLFLVVFILIEKDSFRHSQAINDKDNSRFEELEKELKETQDYLQSTIEELETINEELKSSNEEAQSTNEELQSANEELETSKEELQAVNEELNSTNSELQQTISELTHINDDINNLYTSTQIATIFVDKQLRVTRFTPAAKKLIHIKDSDIGSSLAKFADTLNYPYLIDDTAYILESLIPKEVEIELSNQHFYWMRVLPYRTQKDTIEGVVFTFTDITEKKNREKELINYKNHLEDLVKERTTSLEKSMSETELVKQELETFFSLIPDMACIANTEGYFTKINPAWSELLGYSLDEIKQKPFFELLHPDDLAKTKDYLKRLEYTDTPPRFSNRYRCKNGEYKWLEWMATVAHDSQHIYAIARDITQRLAIEQELQGNREKLNAIVSNFPNGSVSMIDRDLRIIYTDGLEYARFHIDPKTLIGKYLHESISKQNADMAIQSAKEAFSGKTTKYETTFQNNHYLNSLHPVSSANNRVDYIVLVSQNITALKETQEELVISKNRYQSIFETAANVILSVNKQGAIVDCNHQVKHLLGYDQKELIGQKIERIIHPNYWENHYENQKNIQRNGRTIDVYLVLIKKNGDPVHANINASGLNGSNGNPKFMLYVVNDITNLQQIRHELEKTNLELNKHIDEIQDINYQLEKAMIKAEESDRLKTAFLANMSHEIRTPMNSIIGFSDLLTSEELDADKKELYSSLIRNSGEQLLRIISDIIDISKIESNQLKIEKKTIDIYSIINEIIEEQKQAKYFTEKPWVQLIARNIGRLKGHRLTTDPIRLKQIFTNLINNAIKNTDEGFVEIGFELMNDKEQNRIMFYVKDSGVGIAKDQQLIIFNRFTQTPGQSFNRGTGLGLSIVKGILSLLNGKIWLDSEPGKGSVFYFSLPIDLTESMADQGPQKPLSKSYCQLLGKTIYIAEDDNPSYLYVKELMAVTKAKVYNASNGKILLEMMNKKLPDLVLLDINMPVMNGYDAMAEIHKLYPNIPVIAQTVYAMADERLQCLANGCVDYISKPIIKVELFALLNKYIGNK